MLGISSSGGFPILGGALGPYGPMNYTRSAGVITEDAKGLGFRVYLKRKYR